MEYTFYSDRQGHRGRRPWAVVVGPGDSLVEFSESARVGVKFIDSSHEQAGKWSHTTHRVILPPAARLVAGHMGWETNTWREGLADATQHEVVTWLDAARALGVSVASVMAYARQYQKADAAHFDEADRKLAEADDAADAQGLSETVEVEVVVSFGGPTNRAIREGFWEWPLVIRDAQGQVVGHVRPDESECYHDNLTRYHPDPAIPAVVVLDATHSAGYHGGYQSVRLCLPSGWTATHEPQSIW